MKATTTRQKQTSTAAWTRLTRRRSPRSSMLRGSKSYRGRGCPIASSTRGTCDVDRPPLPSEPHIIRDAAANRRQKADDTVTSPNKTSIEDEDDQDNDDNRRTRDNSLRRIVRTAMVGLLRETGLLQLPDSRTTGDGNDSTRDATIAKFRALVQDTMADFIKKANLRLTTTAVSDKSNKIQKSARMTNDVKSSLQLQKKKKEPERFYSDEDRTEDTTEDFDDDHRQCQPAKKIRSTQTDSEDSEDCIDEHRRRQPLKKNCSRSRRLRT